MMEIVEAVDKKCKSMKHGDDRSVVKHIVKIQITNNIYYFFVYHN